MQQIAEHLWYCHTIEHMEIESCRCVSRETEKSKAVVAPRIPDQFVAILGNSS